ncbi:MAG TPA: apolipoprotein N-acyltransferase [Phycisphaerae bacterium]|nr:apolipoprotein N-acyltransferase [Phycisphaerae bacterium]
MRSAADHERITTGHWFFLSLLTPIALTLSFPPFYLWPLALIALAPLSNCVLQRPVRLRYLIWYYLLGLAYFTGNLYWLVGVTWAGYLASCVYLAVYFPAYAILLRLLVLRIKLPATATVPIVFTALEYLRCTLFTGFSWFPLGAALAPSNILLQSADLCGVYGLTFLACIPAGFAADWLSSPPARRVRRLFLQGALAVAIIIAAVGYGVFRLMQQTLTAGPTVAVLQQNIPESIKDTGDINEDKKLFASYMALTQEAAKQHPDLIVWPETMVPGYLNPEWLSFKPDLFSPGYFRDLLVADQQFAAELAEFSYDSGASLLVGSGAIYYGSDAEPQKFQNVAVMFTPTLGESPVIYAKRHLVPFGEYVPFKNWPALHHLLISLTPIGFDYSATPGDQWTHFTLQKDTMTWQFGVPICYEDAMPGPSREFVKPEMGKKGADFLVSISNDGWYQSLAELQQHLQLDQVRAVENRVPIARSVNGGDCGFVDSNGCVGKLVEVNGQSAFVTGVAVEQLMLDSRISPYSRFGDVLPVVLLIFCGMSLIFIILFRREQPKDKTI